MGEHGVVLGFGVVAWLVVAQANGVAAGVAAQEPMARVAPIESMVPVPGAALYARVVGEGRPMIVLHGGPDFDHRYLLPHLDELQNEFRLIYYGQRGRGRSAENVDPMDVSIESDVEDLDRVREHWGLDSAALLGHSWGAVLALEYALRHPERVSHLVLMNPAPVSEDGVARLREAYLERLGAAMERQREILASAAYRAGDPDAVTARYRIHFSIALVRNVDYEALMQSMESAFTGQGAEGILKARAVEDQLMADTWDRPGYDLLPALARPSRVRPIAIGDTRAP